MQKLTHHWPVVSVRRARSAAMSIGLVCSLAVGGSAFGFSGNELYALSGSDDLRLQAMATAYVRGVADASQLALGTTRIVNGKSMDARTICMPDGANVGQAKDLVHLALRDNPADRHLPAVFHVHRSLSLSWPCR